MTLQKLEALAERRQPGTWTVDERAMSIWTDHIRGGKVFDIRGWGHLTGGGAMNLPADQAEAIQRANAELVCELVNNLPAILAALRVAGEGWIIGNARRDMWRTWEDGWSAWTPDRDKATRYHRREDAEAVHTGDEDAWFVTPYVKLETTND